MRTIECTCGAVLRSADEEELYSRVQGHVDRLHPERHRLGVVAVSRHAPGENRKGWWEQARVAGARGMP
ncbi:MAG: hypothetical protein JOZ41_16270 [Chloroflexi bacterium]|nr:hypothetical protein [Chloroflexota bacterium]